MLSHWLYSMILPKGNVFPQDMNARQAETKYMRCIRVRIAAGSLCDENIQYNVPGNLRLWDSETNDCKSLSGHQTVHETTGQGTNTAC